MEVELEFTIKIDGGDPVSYEYKIEDGADQDFCDLVQEARRKCSHKMKTYIGENCK